MKGKGKMAELPYWEAWGPVRGSCGHRHATEVTASRCAQQDNLACKQCCGPNSYSDRKPRLVRDS